MSRHRIDHPTRETVHAYYGHDHAVGFFVEVFREGREKPIASIDFFTSNKPTTVQQCLELLINQGFFTEAELQDTLAHLQDSTSVPNTLQRVEGVVVGFRG